MQALRNLVLLSSLGVASILVTNCTSSGGGGSLRADAGHSNTNARDGGGGATGAPHGTSGTGGRVGGAGANGVGGTATAGNGAGGTGNDASVPTAPGSVGAQCEMDRDCATGLTCLTGNSSSWFGGGPAGGYCTASCGNDPTVCGQFAGTVCVASSATVGFCFEGCARGPLANALDSKCHDREDVACFQFDPNSAPVCQPTCGSDSQCPQGRSCDLLNGVCVDAVPHGDPIGTPCDPTAATSTCGGFCEDFGGGFAVCSGLCTIGLGYSACGVDPSATPAPGAPVCLNLLDTNDALNDTGLCLQRCNQISDCLDPRTHCEPFTDAQTQAAFGATGLCLPAVADGGTSDAGDGG